MGTPNLLGCRLDRYPHRQHESAPPVATLAPRAPRPLCWPHYSGIAAPGWLQTLMRHFLRVAPAVSILLLPMRMTTMAGSAGLVATASRSHTLAAGRFAAHIGAIAIPPVTKPAQRKGQRASSANTTEDLHQAARAAGVDFRPGSCEPNHWWLGRGSVNPSERPGAPTLGLSLCGHCRSFIYAAHRTEATTPPSLDRTPWP